MAKLTIANSNAQHYVKMLCTTTTKPPSTSKFYVDFKKIVFKDQKIETHLSILRCFAPCQVDLWAETLPFQFSRITSKEHSNFIGCHFFHTHVLPHHSKSQLLGVAKSWKVALDRVHWFGRHVENLNDVIVYRSSSCGPEQWLSVIYNWLWKVLLKNNRSRTNKCYSRSLI